MALKGRNRTKANELLGKIRKHYQNNDIQASDYSPDGKGFVPSENTRKLAEERIDRTVESMADYFYRSGNRDMDSSKSAGGDGFLKGKLSFVNTELDKIGKPRITLEELKETISRRMKGPAPQAERIKTPEDMPRQIAREVPVLEEDAVRDRVRSRYLAFAQWLAGREKNFPSLDPEVDRKTMETFDLVNSELREIGKFESMQIFREKTIAYLEDVLDGEIIPRAEPQVAERLRVGLLAEAEDRFGDDARPPLSLRPVRTSLPADFQASSLPLFTSPPLPGTPIEESPRGRFRETMRQPHSSPSGQSLPGKSWTPVRQAVSSPQSLEIRKLGSLPGTPI